MARMNILPLRPCVYQRDDAESGAARTQALEDVAHQRKT
jgi:hypothetical protein